MLPLGCRLTDRRESVNGVLGPGIDSQARLPPLGYLALLLIGFPELIYLPTQWVLQLRLG